MIPSSGETITLFDCVRYLSRQCGSDHFEQMAVAVQSIQTISWEHLTMRSRAGPTASKLPTDTAIIHGQIGIQLLFLEKEVVLAVPERGKRLTKSEKCMMALLSELVLIKTITCT